MYKAQRELRSLARSVSSSVSKSGSQAVVAIKEIDIRVQHDDILATDLTDGLEADVVHHEASPYRSKRSHSVVISGGRKSAESVQTDAAVAYAKIAFLFFLSLIITWVSLPHDLATLRSRPSRSGIGPLRPRHGDLLWGPSVVIEAHDPVHARPAESAPVGGEQGVPSINRIHQTAFPTRSNFALNFLSCLVLPLQGLWNGIIYACASGSATKAAWRSSLESAEGFVDKLRSLVRRKPRRPGITTTPNMEGGLPRQ